MNVKLMLLQYSKGHLRIVISSGNPVPYDYDRIQNIVFIQDCRKLTGEDTVLMKDSEFMKDLSLLLHDLGIFEGSEMPEEYKKFDYSKIKPRIVFSSPFRQTLKCPSGLLMLTEKIQKTFTRLSCLEYQGSLLGAMDTSWLDAFMEVANGDTLLLTPPTMEDVENNQKKSLLQTDITDAPKPSTTIKVVFPTAKFAITSPLGPREFGIVFCHRAIWTRPSYPRFTHHQCISKYGEGRALHKKIITALDQTGKEAWWYIGSANLHLSAWGKLNKPRNHFSISNYELGILFDVDDVKILCPSGFPYPYTRPLVPYTKEDIPWMPNEYRYVEADEQNQNLHYNNNNN